MEELYYAKAKAALEKAETTVLTKKAETVAEAKAEAALKIAAADGRLAQWGGGTKPNGRR